MGSMSIHGLRGRSSEERAGSFAEQSPAAGGGPGESTGVSFEAAQVAFALFPSNPSWLVPPFQNMALPLGWLVSHGIQEQDCCLYELHSPLMAPTMELSGSEGALRSRTLFQTS